MPVTSYKNDNFVWMPANIYTSTEVLYSNKKKGIRKELFVLEDTFLSFDSIKIVKYWYILVAPADYFGTAH